MKRLTLCLALTMPLLTASGAAAKEVVSAKVCGASDCREVKDERSLVALDQGGPPSDPPTRASAFYRAELTVRGDGENFKFVVAVVPRAGLMRGANDDGTFFWTTVSDEAVARVRHITRGLDPIPAAKLAGLDAGGPPRARVDEVVQIAPDRTATASDGAPVWPWIAGGLAALAAIGFLVVVRVRRAEGGFAG